jgi:hypothetical protein
MKAVDFASTRHPSFIPFVNRSAQPRAWVRRWFGLLLASGLLSGAAAQNMVIYDDALQNGWADWGWTAINYNNTTPVHSGSKSISVTITNAWQGIYIAHANFSSTPYSNLTFWIHGGASGNQQLQVQGLLNGTAQAAVSLPAPAANTWQQISISLSSLHVANQSTFSGFWIQGVNSSQPTFYLDDIVLTTNSTPPPGVTLTSPANNSSYTAPATINLAATVVTNGHTINKVQFWSNSTNLLNEATSPPYAFTWNNVAVGAYSLIARVVYDGSSSLDSSSANVTVNGTVSVTITVDAGTNRHAISPLIYGVAFASSSQLTDLNAPVNRSGGNAETRYNWLIDAHNRGGDWYFESISDGSGTPGADADNFITTSKNGGADPLLTVPMIGWPCKLGPGRASLASFAVSKYGPQQYVDGGWAGNGVSLPSLTNIVNDPNDANFQTNSSFWVGWFQHLTSRWGPSTNGGVKYYLMDNEETIWQSTHRDVHPVGPTMQEIRDDILDYGGLVKSNDPNALVCAPEEWGWSGYFYSGYDQQNSGGHDRANNGGWDYCPWLLNQLRLHDTGTGQRLLDYFTLHCYPQSGEFSQTDVSTSMQLLRNRSTRQLWDTNYVDASWIGQQAPPNNILKLIPRMRNWAATYYPGTKIGVTEYNWGAEGYINGATAQADIYGIFGREGLDLGTRWTTPNTGTLVYNAMKMYRNYDGNKSTFGDTSVNASAPNPDNVSTFAAVRSSDGALTLMVVNKQLNANAALTVNLANFVSSGAAQLWQLTAANSITHLSDISVAANTLSATVPAQSVTLFVLPAGAPPPPAPPLLSSSALAPNNTFTFTLNGQSGTNYIVQYSADLVNWTPISTNTLAGSSSNLVFPVPDAVRFYRAQVSSP